ncbi:MAG: hypothetical protein ACFB9M_16715 [Myxococcota bacterium]
MSRRGLGGLVLVAALVSALGLVTSQWNRIRTWLLMKNIQNHFSYLNLDPTGVTRFIEEFEQKVHVLRRNPFKLLSPLPSHAYMSYLASSSFFPEEDYSREVTFVSLYWPYLAVCHNPFSKRLLPNGAENPVDP